MPFNSEIISNPEDMLNELGISERGFSARVAFGVRNKPRSGRTTWLILGVADGKADLAGTAELPSIEAPEDNLEVVLGIAATEDVWSAIGDRDAFLLAVAEQKFFLTGEAPFFIRNLPPIVDLWEAIGRQ